MPFLIGIGIFLLVAFVVAILATKTGFLGDIANIIYWLIKKIWIVVCIVVIGVIAILVIGGGITLFS